MFVALMPSFSMGGSLAVELDLDEEMEVWERLRVESLDEFFESIHDHGYMEREDGTLVGLPSGEVGDVCKTCGKVILPIEQTIGVTST